MEGGGLGVRGVEGGWAGCVYVCIGGLEIGWSPERRGRIVEESVYACMYVGALEIENRRCPKRQRGKRGGVDDRSGLKC